MILDPLITVKCIVFFSASMTKKFTVIIEKDQDDWLVSEVVELPGCHTQAKTMDQLIERTKEAIQAYLEDEEELAIFPEFIGVQQIEV
jgi:predicted RNase H-like HicB family nuclease